MNPVPTISTIGNGRSSLTIGNLGQYSSKKLPDYKQFKSNRNKKPVGVTHSDLRSTYGNHKNNLSVLRLHDRSHIKERMHKTRRTSLGLQDVLYGALEVQSGTMTTLNNNPVRRQDNIFDQSTGTFNSVSEQKAKFSTRQAA